MPSPVRRRKDGAWYRRKDGAWVKVGRKYAKVGANKYPNQHHYSKRSPSSDRKRSAKRPRNRRKARRYPQAYD